MKGGIQFLKKMRYVCLLLVLGTIFVHFSPSVYAVEEDDATSKAGIRFVDRRGPMEESSNINEDSEQTVKPEKGLPKTNEQPAMYLTVSGLIVVACVAGWVGYKKKVK